MLLDNFRPLISFYGSSNFINTAGETVSKVDFMAGQSSRISNNHNYRSGSLAYNYNITTSSNSYIDEQTAYHWLNIIATALGSSDGQNQPHNRHNGFILFVGTGDTPETKSDYKLDNAIPLRVLSASCSHNSDEKTIITRTFYNDTEEDVIIKEVGLYVFRCQPIYGSGATSYAVLIGRKVLETPVLIPVDTSYSFTYTIDMSQISFTEADS